MKTPERDELLDEILTGDNASHLRVSSLDRTLQCVRQQRRWHNTLRGASVVAIVGLVAIVIWSRQRPTGRQQMAGSIQSVARVESGRTIPGTSIRVVNDEELLAMFPNRPVALVGPPERRQFVLLDEKPGASPRKGLHL
jgi:hypothetical protein